MQRKFFIKLIVFMLVGFVFLSGCNLISLLYPEPTPTVIPTPTLEPIRELSVCLGYEPRSLYLYKAVSQAEKEVLRAITDGPIDIDGNGDKTAVLLDQIPTADGGTIRFTPLDVSEGDTVVNSYGYLAALTAGTTVFPSGCTSPACVIAWDGVSEIQIDQMTVTYQLKKDLKWSDGEALSADDSVFSFQVAADPVTPVDKHTIDLTESYTALDEMTVEWKAFPGLVTNDIEKYFWSPLPEHAWTEMSAVELLIAEAVNYTPLSYGPFMVEEWQPGAFIRLTKNPFYHRADEGLPKTDILTYKFIASDDPASLLTAAGAECDLVSSSVLDLQDIGYLEENASSAGMQLHNLTPKSLEMLAVGITPASYDDNYYPYGVDRPDIFGDVRVRQALAHCIDRQTITEKLIGTTVEMAATILPANNPLISGLDLPAYSYDPTQGITLLEQVGWQDSDFNPDTPLAAVNVFNVPFGTPFAIELLITESPLRGEIAAEIEGDLSACGIQADITEVPLNELYQPGPDGLIFGRQFDLALLSAQPAGGFDCTPYKSSEIPSDKNYWLGEMTGGANYFGYSNEEYDTFCTQREQKGLDENAAKDALERAISILHTDLPVIPIYHHPSAYLQADNVCGMKNDIQSADEILIHVENLYTGMPCE